MRVFLIVCIWLIFIVGVLELISRALYHRSLMASLCEIYLRLERMIASKRGDDKDHLSSFHKAKLDKLKSKIDWARFEEFEGIDILSINEGALENSEKVIIYLHGGAYVYPPRYYHLRFVKKLSEKANLSVKFVIYPKAPETCASEVLPKLIAYYKEIVFHGKKVILMGDSSGGGLAASLTMELKKEKVALPIKTILFSPWVDISLDNEDILLFKKIDPMIDVEKVKSYGKLWAREIDEKDYRVSPLFGDVTVFNDVTIFVGNREVLYPDDYTFYLKMKMEKVKCKLVEGNGLNHVYPIYPIPEAIETMKEVVKICLED